MIARAGTCGFHSCPYAWPGLRRVAVDNPDFEMIGNVQEEVLEIMKLLSAVEERLDKLYEKLDDWGSDALRGSRNVEERCRAITRQGHQYTSRLRMKSCSISGRMNSASGWGGRSPEGRDVTVKAEAYARSANAERDAEQAISDARVAVGHQVRFAEVAREVDLTGDRSG